MGQRKIVLIRQVTSQRGSIHMKFSTTRQEKGDLYIQVNAKKGDSLSRFGCRYFFEKYFKQL